MFVPRDCNADASSVLSLPRRKHSDPEERPPAPGAPAREAAGREVTARPENRSEKPTTAFSHRAGTKEEFLTTPSNKRFRNGRPHSLRKSPRARVTAPRGQGRTPATRRGLEVPRVRASADLKARFTASITFPSRRPYSEEPQHTLPTVHRLEGNH